MNIFTISLGCDKNLVDTERMLGYLKKDGYTFTDNEEDADIAVINTCAFIDSAKEESINAILETAKLKETGRLKALVVAGCMAQRYADEILKEIPEVDGIVGTAGGAALGEVIRKALAGEKTSAVKALEKPLDESGARIMTTGGSYSFLKIADGCDKYCSYCIIPKLRGHYHSVPMEQLVREAKELADQGVKELILVAQETTIYGTDLYGKKMLPELLKKLSSIEGITWIRIQYCYPEEITEELIDAIKELPKVCHYLDIPVQHASDRILKRMNRKTTEKELRDIIGMIREKIPDMAIRTTFITGFPGETRTDQAKLLRFVDEMRFDRLGVFTYSAEEGTPAAAFPDQVPEEEKERRRDAVMELQQKIAFSMAMEKEGKILDVLVEGTIPDEEVYVGRTYMDAPGVDGLIFFESPAKLMTGDFVRVLVTGADGYDLIGEMYDEPAE